MFKAILTYQRHTSLLPIYEIDNVAFCVLDAQIDQYEHYLIADDVRTYIKELDGESRIELEVRFPRQGVRASRLEAQKPKHRLGRSIIVVIVPGEARHLKNKKRWN
jgi:hypothetical protein